MSKSRRGWRESLEPGIHRIHRLACPSTRDHREGRRCACPFELQAPGYAPGRTRTVTFSGSISEARAERRRLLSAGRPQPPAAPVDAGTLDEFTVRYLRAAAPRQAPNDDPHHRRRVPPPGVS